jgi:hypothetical protein
MLWSSLKYSWAMKAPEAAWAIVLVVIGVALSFYDPTPKQRP